MAPSEVHVQTAGVLEGGEMARDPGGSLRRLPARASNGVGSGGSRPRSDDPGSDQPTQGAAAARSGTENRRRAGAERQPFMGRATAPLYRLRSRHLRNGVERRFSVPKRHHQMSRTGTSEKPLLLNTLRPHAKETSKSSAHLALDIPRRSKVPDWVSGCDVNRYTGPGGKRWRGQHDSSGWWSLHGSHESAGTRAAVASTWN
jgi:hypothetical protein